ncbi:putative HTH-type transcriptional regulator YwbI [Paenibacillus baekrokdamisoli]|uniref:Putative HTH-type transcriptional regulator YwbI n=1 Tax=Paenibacillus baekrokdamisoli TaxID=1712516 RepID=A0A3G9JEX7_9BACL|nr:LysR family transcriptional regulator [Paenibacillus baekrokdamisoli]MBB3073031.1 DNA-binding transcriptional LysR family regulator [Paenibacillus baekrokdamisoli]BBH21734.1 putative HTH-type transcriptional regulator YwbI [Paenibacillus baekrokdamisoli]
MDIRQLSYFLEVAKEVSFSKASVKLHLSQPTLSKVVKNLEEEIGMALFDRSTRRMHLTEAGEVVQAQAQMIIQSMENLLSAVADLSQMKTGKFRLGLPPVIGSSFFPEIIAQFHALHPQIKIELIEEGGKLIERSLLEGNIDLGIVVLPVDEQLFEIVPIIQRELKLVVNIKHPLAGRNKVNLQELQNEAFILFRQGFAIHDRVREACIRKGFEPNISYESTQWDLMSEMVIANLGISLLPETITAKLDPTRICIIPEIEPAVHWNLGIIWAKNKYLSHAARGWIEFVRDRFQVN